MVQLWLYFNVFRKSDLWQDTSDAILLFFCKNRHFLGYKCVSIQNSTWIAYIAARCSHSFTSYPVSVPSQSHHLFYVQDNATGYFTRPRGRLFWVFRHKLSGLPGPLKTRGPEASEYLSSWLMVVIQMRLTRLNFGLTRQPTCWRSCFATLRAFSSVPTSGRSSSAILSAFMQDASTFRSFHLEKMSNRPLIHHCCLSLVALTSWTLNLTLIVFFYFSFLKK